MKEDGYLHERVQEPTPGEVQYRAREYLEDESNDRERVQGLSDNQQGVAGAEHRTQTDNGTDRRNGKGRSGRKTYSGLNRAEQVRLAEIIRNHVSNGKNFLEAREIIALYLGKKARDMNYLDWQKAYSILAEELYNAVYNEDIVVVEKKFSYLSSDISALIEELKPDAYDFTQYQPRIESLSDREVLQLAEKELKKQELNMSDAERDALRITNERLAKLHELEAERKEAGILYRQQQFGKGSEHNKAPAYLTPGAGAHIISITGALRQAVSSLSKGYVAKPHKTVTLPSGGFCFSQSTVTSAFAELRLSLVAQLHPLSGGVANRLPLCSAGDSI